MKVKGLWCGVLCVCLLTGCSRQPGQPLSSDSQTSTTASVQTEAVTTEVPLTTAITEAESATQSAAKWPSSTREPAKATTKITTKATTTKKQTTQASAVTTQAPVQEKTFHTGETWEVNGQWKLTFTGVARHTFCNRFSDSAGYKDCLILTYDYENLGYTGSYQDLFFSSVSFYVYDADGEAADTYPCTHTAAPKVCAVGTKCTGAQQAYQVKNTGDTVTVKVEYYTSTHQKEKATFKLNVTGGTSPSDSGSPSPIPSDVETYEGFAYAPDFGAMLNIPYYQKGNVTVKGSIKSQSIAYSISSLEDNADTCIRVYDSLLRRCGYSYSETTSDGDLIYMNRPYGSSVMIGVSGETRMVIVTVAGPVD